MEEDGKAGVEVDTTREKELAKFQSQILECSPVPQSSIAKQEEEINITSKKELAKFHSQILNGFTSSQSSITKEKEKRRKEEEKRMMKTWIRNKPDADGYFLLQLEKKIEHNDMFLTAEDAASLTIAGK